MYPYNSTGPERLVFGFGFEIAKIALTPHGLSEHECAGPKCRKPRTERCSRKARPGGCPAPDRHRHGSAFLWTSLPDGSKEYLNKRWYEYTGLSLEEGKGWGWKVVVHPDDLDRLIREWLSLVEARKPGELETRIRRYDGEYRWFLIRIVPKLDAEGNVIRWFGSNTDIEDRKRAEKKLLEEERELRRITDAIPQTIVVQDPSGHLLYANQAMLDYTGLTMEDVVTSDYRASIYHPEDLERAREERKAGLARD